MKGHLQVKEKLKGHRIEGAPSEEAGDVPGVLAVEDDEQGCGVMPSTSVQDRDGEAAGTAHKARAI